MDKWYGGTVPLGFDYDQKKKSLIPNEKERLQYLLKGLVKCGDCGSFMSPKSAKNG